MKAKLLIETVVAAEPFKKKTSDEIKKYLRKTEAIQNQFKKVYNAD
jgi:hypothetical protein